MATHVPITGAPTCAPVSQSRFDPSLAYTQHARLIPAFAPQSTLRDSFTIDIDKSRSFALAAALRRFDRTQIDCAIEVLIAVLDAADGDPDAETGNDLEDDFALSPRAIYMADGPGCEITDPDAQCSEDEISCGSSGIHGQGAGCALSDPAGGECAQ